MSPGGITVEVKCYYIMHAIMLKYQNTALFVLLSWPVAFFIYNVAPQLILAESIAISVLLQFYAKPCGMHVGGK